MRALSVAQESAFYARTVPPAEQIRDGVWVIPVPVTGGSMPFTLCYVVEDDRGGIHLVDSGVDTDEAWQTLESGLAAFGRRIDDVASVTATHMHYDHIGLASRLRRASGAEFRLHERDAVIRLWTQDELDELLVEWGVPSERIGELAPAVERATHRGCGIDVDRVLTGGELLDIPGRAALVISTPGHTDGSCCFSFADEGLLMLGDHLLPANFPGIALGGKAASGNAIADYVQSLDDLLPLDGAECLPGHGFCFSGLGDRLRDTRAHHLNRNAEIAAAFAATGGSVWQIASSVGWSNGWAGLSIFHRFSALMQTYLHLAATPRLAAADS